jgi:hypothetical protein
VFTGPLSRKNSKSYLVFSGLAGKIDTPARAGILASFEPEGEAALLLS